MADRIWGVHAFRGGDPRPLSDEELARICRHLGQDTPELRARINELVRWYRRLKAEQDTAARASDVRAYLKRLQAPVEKLLAAFQAAENPEHEDHAVAAAALKYIDRDKLLQSRRLLRELSRLDTGPAGPGLYNDFARDELERDAKQIYEECTGRPLEGVPEHFVMFVAALEDIENEGGLNALRSHLRRTL